MSNKPHHTARGFRNNYSTGARGKIHQDIRARRSVAMHRGTFILTDEPLDEPPHRLAAARLAAGIAPEKFFLMKHGETRKLAPMFRSGSASVPTTEPAITR